jgi:hypothetical protein
MPALDNCKKAGYGVASSCEDSVMAGMSLVLGIMRLGALAEGVKKGVLRVEVAALSLLRERFEEEGDGGTASWVAEVEAMSELVFIPVFSFAFRRKARSLCSLKMGLSAPDKAAASGRGGTKKLEPGMVTVGRRARRGCAVACRYPR